MQVKIVYTEIRKAVASHKSSVGVTLTILYDSTPNIKATLLTYIQEVPSSNLILQTSHPAVF
jgi:hypothetical protein